MIAVISSYGRQEPRVFVARVETFNAEQRQATVVLFEVPKGERYGPWHRRRWEVRTDSSGAVVKETIPYAEILTTVELQAGALTQRSLELLSAAGVEVSATPHISSTLPRATI